MDLKVEGLFCLLTLMVEALAIRAALSNARILNIQHIQVESDCRVLVQVIIKQSTISEIHGVISNILILFLFFSSFSCISIPRAKNVVPDSLAKQAL